ncbi:MAG: histidinol-phosphatase [Pseudomonadota bacterium]
MPKETPDPNPPGWVSVHGGHSGEFCQHASDTLSSVVEAYIEKGFLWVGLTEHAPPPDDRWRYPDEVSAGLTAAFLQARFARYMAAARAVQAAVAHRLRVFVGFETESYPGGIAWARHLIDRYRPDYVVGSVHHVGALAIDFSREGYDAAAAACGGIDGLYCRYFDRQFEMLQRLCPAVVGHLDLVRLFDPDYPERLNRAEIARRITRNLTFIAEQGLILDFNLAALSKGASEPYVAPVILRQAFELGIAAVPGDDSHGVATVGRHMVEGIHRLAAMGFSTDWKTPVRE